MIDIFTTVNAQAVDIGLQSNGCGHTIIMTKEHHDACRETRRTWYCTVCGQTRIFTGKTTIDELRGQLSAAQQREETLKRQRNDLEVSLAQEQKSKIRLKRRIKNGVCPCCTRSFQNLRRHLETKHPQYARGAMGKTEGRT